MASFNLRRCMARPGAGTRCCIIPIMFLFLTLTFTSIDKKSYSAKESLFRVVREDYQETTVSMVTSEMTPAIEIRRLLLLTLKAHYQKLPSNPMDIIKIVKKMPNDKSFDVVQHPWTALGINMTSEIKKSVFRSAYQSITNSTYHNIMLTKENAMDDVDSATMKELPMKSLLPPPPYKTCAVVGSSGILTRSKCGADIDKTDFVFRFNLVPVHGFEKDVGRKTNMTTLNPSILTRFGGLKTKEDASNFSRLLVGQTGFVWTPIEKLNATLNPLQHVNGLSHDLTFIRSNIRHLNAHREFWSLLGMKKKPSTGFYFVNVASSLCSDVHVYGFWPYDKGLDRLSVPYHYHDEVKMASQNNEMFAEFKMLIAMHRLGLVNLHVVGCS